MKVFLQCGVEEKEVRGCFAALTNIIYDVAGKGIDPYIDRLPLFSWALRPTTAASNYVISGARP